MVTLLFAQIQPKTLNMAGWWLSGRGLHDYYPLHLAHPRRGNRLESDGAATSSTRSKGGSLRWLGWSCAGHARPSAVLATACCMATPTRTWPPACMSSQGSGVGGRGSGGTGLTATAARGWRAAGIGQDLCSSGTASSPLLSPARGSSSKVTDQNTQEGGCFGDKAPTHFQANHDQAEDVSAWGLAPCC